LALVAVVGHPVKNLSQSNPNPGSAATQISTPRRAAIDGDSDLIRVSIQPSGLTAQNLAVPFSKTVPKIDSEFSFIPPRLLITTER